MRRATKIFLALATAALIYAPIDARADGYVSPWAGVNFAAGRLDNGRGSFGVQAGGMGAGIVGGEVDFGYSPSAFGNQNDFGNNSIINLMGNVIVGVPIGGTYGKGFRPFVTGGLGLIRSQIDGGSTFNVASSSNNLGWDLGVGAMGFFNDHAGIRGDLRYFRNVTGDVIGGFDQSSLHFWRLGFGVVIR
jgi:outer membrane protein with beta-barrel domain